MIDSSIKQKEQIVPTREEVREDYVLAESWKMTWLGQQVGKGHSTHLPCYRSRAKLSSCEAAQEIWQSWNTGLMCMSLGKG